MEIIEGSEQVGRGGSSDVHILQCIILAGGRWRHGRIPNCTCLFKDPSKAMAIDRHQPFGSCIWVWLNRVRDQQALTKVDVGQQNTWTEVTKHSHHCVGCDEGRIQLVTKSPAGGVGNSTTKVVIERDKKWTSGHEHVNVKIQIKIQMQKAVTVFERRSSSRQVRLPWNGSWHS